MKRIYLILFSLFLLVSVQGQVVSSSVWFAQASSGGGGSYTDFINANAEALYIADVANFSTSGDTLKWEDQTANGHDLKQPSTTGNKPTYGGDTIYFDGEASGSLGDWMRTEVFTLEQPITIYLVIKQNSWASGEMIMDGTATNTVRLEQEGTTPELRLYAGGFLGNNSDLTVGDWAVVAIVSNGSSSKIQVNNETAVTGDIGTADMDGITFGTYGGSESSFGHFSLKYAAFIPSVVSSGDEAAIITGLTTDYID